MVKFKYFRSKTRNRTYQVTFGSGCDSICTTQRTGVGLTSSSKPVEVMMWSLASLYTLRNGCSFFSTGMNSLLLFLFPE